MIVVSNSIVTVKLLERITVLLEYDLPYYLFEPFFDLRALFYTSSTFKHFVRFLSKFEQDLNDFLPILWLWNE